VIKKPGAVWVRYLVSIVLLTVAYFLSFYIEPISQGHSLYLFMAAVVLISLYGGLTAGIIASIVAAFLHSYSFQEPRNTIGIGSIGDAIQIVSFLVVSVSLSFIGASMKRARNKAEESSIAREDVLAVVSHDLRNPLTAIKMSVELGLKTVNNPEAAKRALESISRAADRMNGLITDLLEQEKIRAGKLTVSPSRQELRSLMSEVTEVGSLLAIKKSIEFSASIGAGSKETTLFCDRPRILQVFSNLIGNAVKFTNEKGKVTIQAIPSEEKIEFIVQDTGPGIKSDDLSKVFDRYWQAQHTAKQGTGLGLAISKGIVEAHHGKIWAESEPGQGSAFHFTIPNQQNR
jgi:signal transduction histidine kinase